MTTSEHLRFALLGQVRAWRGDREIELGPPQQQAVLSVLLLREGTAVSPAELIDALWTDDVPTSAGHVIRSYIHRLRKALSDGGSTKDSPIKSAGRGYLLRIDPDSLDLAAFRQGVGLAQEASRSGHPEKAVTLYDEALGRWRGTALAGIGGAFAEEQRQHLEMQRLTALEASVVERIELGDYPRANVVLARLAVEHPLNERFRELRMVPLYRHRRQSDALAVYQETRGLLAEELGVDPGPALQSLYERILRADPSLLPAAPSVASTGGSKPDGSTAGRPLVSGETGTEPMLADSKHQVPMQLPADLREFVGRRRELAAIAGMVVADEAGPGLSTIVITGLAGVGKTALAVHLAHRIADRFPDGQVYLNLRGFDSTRPSLTPEEALAALFDSLEIRRPEHLPADIDRQAAYLPSVVAERRLLFFFDNVRHVDQIRPLLPGGDGCQVLVTSRHQLRALAVAEGAKVIELDVPPAEDAVELFSRRLTGCPGESGRAEMAAIAEQCGRLPLAIAVVAARVATHCNLADALAQLRSEDSLFDALVDPDADVDIRSVFSWSLKALSGPALGLFRLLPLNGSPNWDERAAASLSRLKLPVVRRLLAELVAANLLLSSGPGIFTYHDLIRAYAAELAAPQKREAVHRLLDHYATTALGAGLLLNPIRRPIVFTEPTQGTVSRQFTDHAEALAWFVTNREALLMAQALAIEEGP